MIIDCANLSFFFLRTLNSGSRVRCLHWKAIHQLYISLGDLAWCGYYKKEKIENSDAISTDEWPFIQMSHMLTILANEKAQSQIRGEGLSMLFGVTRITGSKLNSWRFLLGDSWETNVKSQYLKTTNLDSLEYLRPSRTPAKQRSSRGSHFAFL